MANYKDYPEVVDFYPTLSDSPISDLTPTITLAWSIDVVTTQFSDPAVLPSKVSMTKLSTGENIPLTYVGYTLSTRTISLTPSASLETNTDYQIIVHRGIRDTLGRSHRIDRTWFFSTAAAELGDTVLISPTAYSLQSIFPTFSWVDEGYDYQFQLDDSPDFGTVLEDVVLTGGTYTPSVSYPDEKTYYWRVRSISGSASGDWSGIRSFFFGDTSPAHPDTRTEYATTLVLTGVGFDDSYSNQYSFPDIEFYFSSSLSTAATSFVSIHKTFVSPRNDLNYTYAASGVAGDWSISGSTLIFTPSESIEENTRYEIKLKAGLPSSSGYTLEKTTKYYITGPYTPYYCHLTHVQAFLGREALMVDNDLINFVIHMQSLEANAQYQADLGGIVAIGPEGITESDIRSPDLVSHAVMRWTAASSAYMILKRTLNDELRNLGRSVRLADYAESLDNDFLEGLEAALRNAKEEAEKWASELIGILGTEVVSPISGWCEGNWVFDKFIGGAEFRYGLEQ